MQTSTVSYRYISAFKSLSNFNINEKAQYE